MSEDMRPATVAMAKEYFRKIGRAVVLGLGVAVLVFLATWVVGKFRGEADSAAHLKELAGPAATIGILVFLGFGAYAAWVYRRQRKGLQRDLIERHQAERISRQIEDEAARRSEDR